MFGQARSPEQLAFAVPRDALARRCGDDEAAEQLSSFGSELRRRIACLPPLAETLIAHGAHGRAYLEQAETEAEAEAEEPFLFLPALAPRTAPA